MLFVPLYYSRLGVAIRVLGIDDGLTCYNILTIPVQRL